MQNSTLRRASETKQAVVVLPKHNNNSFITCAALKSSL